MNKHYIIFARNGIKSPTEFNSEEDYLNYRASLISKEAAETNEEMLAPAYTFRKTAWEGHDLDYFSSKNKYNKRDGKKYTEKELIGLIRDEFTDYYNELKEAMQDKAGWFNFKDPLKGTFEESGYKSKKAYENDKQKLAFYADVIKDPTILKPGTAKTRIPHFGCISTATASYFGINNAITNNEDFNKILKSRGFKMVKTNIKDPYDSNLDLLPGDIILNVRIKDGIAHHARMYGTDFLGNIVQTHADDAGPGDHTNTNFYSPGEIGRRLGYNARELFGDKVAHTIGASTNDTFNIIRYVGTNAERAQWRREYQAAKSGKPTKSSSKLSSTVINKKQKIQDLQLKLIDEGFLNDVADGIIGSKTRAAIRKAKAAGWTINDKTYDYDSPSWFSQTGNIISNWFN